MSAVTMLPVSCTSPVPTRFRMPSASLMMRESSWPACVASKKRTGSRATCSSTRRRMSVIARCAATPRTWESAKDVTAWTNVAAPATSASGTSRSARPCPATSSMRYFEEAGSTSPASRFTSIKERPRPMRPRRAQTSSRASRHTAAASSFFFLPSLTAAASAAVASPRRPRARSDRGRPMPPLKPIANP